MFEHQDVCITFRPSAPVIKNRQSDPLGGRFDRYPRNGVFCRGIVSCSLWGKEFFVKKDIIDRYGKDLPEMCCRVKSHMVRKDEGDDQEKGMGRNRIGRVTVQVGHVMD